MRTYYIIGENGKEGPLDLVAIVKRVRNGKIYPGTMLLSNDDEEPRAANSYDEIRAFFEELTPEPSALPASSTAESLDIGVLLRDAWYSYGEHQGMTVLTAICYLIFFCSAYGLYMLVSMPAALFFVATISGFYIHCFGVLMLFRYRAQRIDSQAVNLFFSASGLSFMTTSLALSALLLGIPAMLGIVVTNLAFLLLIPGFLAYGLFIFAPMLWMDNKASGLTAYSKSASWVFSQHIDTIGIVLLLLFINAMAAAVFMFPMCLTLPITMLALNDLYEQYILPNS